MVFSCPVCGDSDMCVNIGGGYAEALSDLLTGLIILWLCLLVIAGGE